VSRSVREATSPLVAISCCRAFRVSVVGLGHGALVHHNLLSQRLAFLLDAGQRLVRACGLGAGGLVGMDVASGSLENLVMPRVVAHTVALRSHNRERLRQRVDPRCGGGVMLLGRFLFLGAGVEDRLRFGHARPC
jgi:hypothetical protein